MGPRTRAKVKEEPIEDEHNAAMLSAENPVQSSGSTVPDDDVEMVNGNGRLPHWKDHVATNDESGVNDMSGVDGMNGVERMRDTEDMAGTSATHGTYLYLS